MVILDLMLPGVPESSGWGGVPGYRTLRRTSRAPTGQHQLRHLSLVISGRCSPSPAMLKKLHGVLFQRTGTVERVVPAEVKVLGWRKGERRGMVVKGVGGPGRGEGGGAIRTGGHVPWGAEVEYAYRAGYDSRGRVSVTHIVERGYCTLLRQPEAATT